MSLRSVTFATPPVLTQDSQGPQTVDPLTPRLADQILCIRRVVVDPNRIRFELARYGELRCSEHLLTSWWGDNEIGTALEKEQQLSKERGTKVQVIIPVNLYGYLLGDTWLSGYRAQIRRRLAADFYGLGTRTGTVPGTSGPEPFPRRTAAKRLGSTSFMLHQTKRVTFGGKGDNPAYMSGRIAGAHRSRIAVGEGRGPDGVLGKRVIFPKWCVIVSEEVLYEDRGQPGHLSPSNHYL
jgi:hypothetical protein